MCVFVCIEIRRTNCSVLIVSYKAECYLPIHCIDSTQLLHMELLTVSLYLSNIKLNIEGSMWKGLITTLVYKWACSGSIYNTTGCKLVNACIQMNTCPASHHKQQSICTNKRRVIVNRFNEAWWWNNCYYVLCEHWEKMYS